MTNSSVRQDRVAANGEQKGSLKGGQPVLPRRGFPVGEFEARLSRAQAFLRRDRLDALLVTSPQQVRYFTGFDSQFWESPTATLVRCCTPRRYAYRSYSRDRGVRYARHLAP